MDNPQTPSQQPTSPAAGPLQSSQAGPNPQQPSSANKNNTVLLVVTVLLLLIVGSGGYAMYSLNATNATPTPSPIPSPTPQATVRPSPTASNTADTNALRAGGSSFSDAQGVFTILYPSDFKLDTSDPQHPRVYKTGATQRGQTEMYDGVVVVFETITLNGKSLSTWVDEHIATSTADGTSQVTSPKKAYSQNTYPGFTYELQGIGTAKYFVVQKDAASSYAVVITTSVNDPQNIGFQAEVDKTLATLQMLK